MFVNELFAESTEQKLIAIFRKEKPHHAKVYLWKTGPGENAFEMEVGQEKKRIPVTLPFEKIKATMALKGFTESLQLAGKLLVESQNNNRYAEIKKELDRYKRIEDGGNALSTGERKNRAEYRKELKQLSTKKKTDEASMTKSVPSKKEGAFHKGVEKLVGQQVAVVVVDYPDSVAYGMFKRIGETGLCHIKLNGGKLPGWASGDMIAVRPSEVYAPWDTRLQGMTAVHKEYENGEKVVREAGPTAPVVYKAVKVTGNKDKDLTIARKLIKKAKASAKRVIAARIASSKLTWKNPGKEELVVAAKQADKDAKVIWKIMLDHLHEAMRVHGKSFLTLRNKDKVNEIDDATVQNLQAKRLIKLRTTPGEEQGEIEKSKVRGMWDRVAGRQALKRRLQNKQNPPAFTDD